MTQSIDPAVDQAPTLPVADSESQIDDDLPIVAFEAISDEELLELFKQAGQPSVLGKIDGQLTVIPIRRFAGTDGLL